MARGGCCLGTLLTIVAFVILFVVIVIPALPGAENNQTIMGWLEPVLCKSGETLSQTTSVVSDSRGTSRSPHYYCEGAEPATRHEVTNKAVMYGAVGFVGPFLVGLFLIIFGSMALTRKAAQSAIKMAQTVDSTRGVAYGTNPDGSITVNAGGIPVHIKTASRTFTTPGQSPDSSSAAEKLQQLGDLLAKNLITQEEYDRLRREILDESF